jgi:hypothetical protein
MTIDCSKAFRHRHSDREENFNVSRSVAVILSRIDRDAPSLEL